MAQHGWKQLLDGDAWHRGRGKYSICAYSEFMPPPRLGRKPYGPIDSQICHDDDPAGWHINEFEQHFQLAPGWDQIGRQLITALAHLGRGEPAHGIGKAKLKDNPYWPEGTLAPAAERYVFLSPLAISQTQDDKGRVRWTLFGASEQGPAKAFWRGLLHRGEAALARRTSARFSPPAVGGRLWRRPGPAGRPGSGRLSRDGAGRRPTRRPIGTSIGCPIGPNRSSGSRTAS